MTTFPDGKRLVMVTVLGGVVGAVVFWLYQAVFQGATIPGFIGAQIVKQGGYALSPALVGGTVHLGVSLAYGLVMALIAQIPYTSRPASNHLIALAVAIALGMVTTAIAAPAIQVTISLLSGKGFPGKLWGLNPLSGHILWNHLLFFALVWLVDIPAARISSKSA